MQTKFYIKTCLSTMLLFAMTSTFFSQSVYEPSVVILSPNEIIVHEELKKQIDSLNISISDRLKYIDWKEREKSLREELKDETENIRVMELKKLAFMKKANYFSSLSSISEIYLQYKLFTEFENLMIYAVSDKLQYSDMKNLHAISGKYNSRYVLNFPQVELFKNKDGKTCSLDVQLYDKKKRKIVLSKTFKGNDENPGFEFACEPGSLDCTFNNSLATALPEIIRIIYENNSKTQKKKNLLITRNEILLNDYYLKPTDNLIPATIKDEDESLPIKSLYQGILNSEKNKFISFFVLNTEGMSLKDLINKKEKKNVEILSNSFGEIPNTVGFLVIGIKKESKWILKKEKISYFDSSDIFEARKKYFSILQALDFFKPESIEVNPDFWDTDLFDFN